MIARLCTVVVAAAALAGCGGSGAPDEERDAILRVLDQARDHVVAGREREACALLTPHGRERSLGYGRAYEDTQSCERALRWVVGTAEDERLFGPTDLDVLADTRFEVEEVDGDRARVTARSGADEATIELRRTPAGWRIHDSPVVPVGD
jgi:hypothetical protein